MLFFIFSFFFFFFFFFLLYLIFFFFFFFFQAEDGIRDLTVTGLQWCALPISCSRGRRPLEVPLLEVARPEEQEQRGEAEHDGRRGEDLDRRRVEQVVA